jgi:hypothetical protein
LRCRGGDAIGGGHAPEYAVLVHSHAARGVSEGETKRGYKRRRMWVGGGRLKERTDLACSCFTLVRLVPEQYALICELVIRPMQRNSMELFKATALEVVADNGDA